VCVCVCVCVCLNPTSRVLHTALREPRTNLSRTQWDANRLLQVHNLGCGKCVNVFVFEFARARGCACESALICACRVAVEKNSRIVLVVAWLWSKGRQDG
jgi:hypothetical protein